MAFKDIKKQTQGFSESLYKVLREYSESLFLAILLALFVRGFILTAYRVPTEAMAPEIKPGDFIFANRLSYGLEIPIWGEKIFVKEPRRNDVVVFKCPLDEEVSCIKRVVAISGDEVEIKQNQLIINGTPALYQPLKNENPELLWEQKKESWGVHKRVIQFSKEAPFEDMKKIKVPKGHFFVLGDFRTQSEDSRVWGAISNASLQGRAFMVWFSISYEDVGQGSSSSRVRWHRIFRGIH